MVSTRRIPQNSASSSRISQHHRATELRVRKNLTRLTLTFFVCWLPLNLIMIRLKFYGFPGSSLERSLLQVFLPFSQILGSCNSCVNPILYALLNRRFRETLRTSGASRRAWDLFLRDLLTSNSNTSSYQNHTSREREMRLGTFIGRRSRSVASRTRSINASLGVAEEQTSTRIRIESRLQQALPGGNEETYL